MIYRGQCFLAVVWFGSLPSPLPSVSSTGGAMQRHNTEYSKQIFLEKELCGLSSNFHIHVSVSGLYIPTIGLPILLQEKYVDCRFWKYINGSQTHACVNWDWGRAIPCVGIHRWDFSIIFVAVRAGRLRKSDNLLTGDGGWKGVGEEPNHTTVRKPEFKTEKSSLIRPQPRLPTSFSCSNFQDDFSV